MCMDMMIFLTSLIYIFTSNILHQVWYCNCIYVLRATGIFFKYQEQPLKVTGSIKKKK